MLVELTNHPEFIKNPDLALQITHILYGGGPCTKQQCENYRKIFKNAVLLNMYASTEMIQCHAFWNGSEDHELNIRKVNSAGKVPVACYWKIRDIETGKSLGNNQVGELLIKGPTLMKGYYNDPEGTAKAIDEDGFFHSGDLVLVDDDDCLFYMGRCKEVLKYKNFQVIKFYINNHLIWIDYFFSSDITS